MTEDQGATWRRIFTGGHGQQQSKGFAEGTGYAIGLAVNPFKQGELVVTAGDRPPGQTHSPLLFLLLLFCFAFYLFFCFHVESSLDAVLNGLGLMFDQSDILFEHLDD